MIDDATETTTIRPLTEDELHAVAGGFSVVLSPGGRRGHNGD
jgi:hypothetical protein